LKEEIVAVLKSFFQLKGNPKQVLTDLTTLFSRYNTSHSRTQDKVTRAINHLNRLLKVLEDFLVPVSKLSFETSLVYPKEFTAGLCFQIIGVLEKDGKKRLDCLAFGGRYDSLIEYFEKKVQGDAAPCLRADGIPEEEGAPKLIAVGLTLAVDKIVGNGREEKGEVPKNVDAYVVSSKTLFSERIQISTKLWQAGIRTDFVRNRSYVLAQQIAIASRNAKYIIQLDDDSYYVTGMLKIVNTDTNVVDTVHKERLTSHINSKFGLGDSPHTSTSPNYVPIKTQTTTAPAYTGRKEQQIRNSYLNSLGLAMPNQNGFNS